MRNHSMNYHTFSFVPMRRVLVLMFALLGLALPAAAQSEPTDVEQDYRLETVHDTDSRVASRLIFSDVQVRPGDTFRVGVAFDIDPSWHIYWQNPGDAGLPTDIKWTADHLHFGELKWAAPTTFLTDEERSYGYKDEVVLYSDVTVDNDAIGEVKIRADIDYLACSDLCLPGYASLSRAITVGQERIPAGQATASLLDASEKRVPKRASEAGLKVRAHYDASPVDKVVKIVLEVINCKDAREICALYDLQDIDPRELLIADGYSALDFTITNVQKHPEAEHGWVFSLNATVREPRPMKKAVLSSVLMLQDAEGEPFPIHILEPFTLADADNPAVAQTLPTWDPTDNARVEVTDEAEAVDTLVASEPVPKAPQKRVSLLWMLVMAFVGGVILNLMPCVFPVLALKISSFATLAHEERSEVVRHGAAYTFGVVGTLWLLAAAVIALRVTGTQVGWGFQFQQPGFLAALIIILVLFSMNLFGVFELSVQPQRLTEEASNASGVKRSVLEGVLAVVLATPCSAPFLGVAIGFALTSGPLAIFLIFTMVALGLAAPLVILTLVPGWAKLLPPPGNWMVHLKTFLGFALMGSAVWISWLMGRAAGVDAMAAVMMFAALLAVGVWLFGLVQYQGWGKQKVAGMLGAVAAIAMGAFLAFPLPIQKPNAAVATSDENKIAFTPWSEEAVQAALAEGRPVFVDFTADWCLTCQVNKKNAIETDATRDAAEQYNVAMFLADWTHTNEDIRQKLAEHGRAGIPFYLVYSPTDPDNPAALSEVITQKSLVNAFKKAAGADG